MAPNIKHRIAHSYLIFIAGFLCFVAAFTLSFFQLSGSTELNVVGLILCLWSSVVLTSSKITAADIKEIIIAFRSRLPP